MYLGHRFISACVCVFFLQGCATVKPQITSDAIDFNKAVENTNNEVAFLNIIRAFKRMPRHYTAISDIKGNFTVGASAALESSIGLKKSRVSQSTDVAGVLTSGSVVTSAAEALVPKFGTTYQTNPNYTVAVLESQKFYNGILAPIPHSTLTLFRHQGWDTELLIHLLFEDMIFTLSSNGSSASYRIKNDSRIQGWHDIANNLVLRTRPNISKEKILLVTNTLDADGVARLLEQKARTRACTSKDIQLNCRANRDYLVYLPKTSSVGLDVFREGAMTSDARKHILSGFQGGDKGLLDEYLEKCNVKMKSVIFSFQDNLAESMVTTDVSKNICKPKLEISTRSVDGIVYFIGEYLRRTEEEKWPRIDIGQNHAALFTLGSGDSVNPVLSANLLGRTYNIPAEDRGGRSMQVISLVQQLLNLNKSSDDLPRAQLIQVQ